MAVKLGRRAKEWGESETHAAQTAAIEAAGDQLLRLEMMQAIPKAGFEHAFDATVSEGVDRVQDGLETLLEELLQAGVTPEEAVVGFARTLKGIASAVAGGAPYPVPELMARTNEIYLLLRDMQAHPAGCIYLLAEAVLMIIVITGGQQEAARLAERRPGRRGRGSR